MSTDSASKELSKVKVYVNTLDRASDWDPLKDKESDGLTHTAKSRIKRDLINLYTEPPPGIFVVGDDTNMKFIYSMVVGPMDTPYEGGFFYFIIKCPNDYPIQAPRVKFMTTDGGRVRFNPNLYASGKVCVSTLGTWFGPAWSPAQQLASLLITIQSLLCEKPYFNEPGITKEQFLGDSTRYNEVVTHETLRVAVCGMLENDCKLNICHQLRDIMEKMFITFYDHYMEIVSKNKHLNGKVIMDPLGNSTCKIDYNMIEAQLIAIHEKLTKSDNE